MSRPAAGEIRQSQIISTYGPGAMVDLPDHAVLIGGLDHWYGQMRPITEDRLARKVSEVLAIPNIKMKAPPVDESDPRAPRTGIAAFKFPEWFVAQLDPPAIWKDPVTSKEYRSRPLVHWESLVQGKYLDDRRKKRKVVPVRFVQGCPNGHILDVNWYAFVHEDFKDPCRGQLWIDEGGSGNDMADIFVRCEACRKRRPLGAAKVPDASVLGHCRGRMPWLGPMAREECVNEATGKPHANRLLIRTASNVFFSQVLSVISIPEPNKDLRDAVAKVYESHLATCPSLDFLKMLRGLPEPQAALEGFTDADVWAEIQRRQNPQDTPDEDKPIKQAEIETRLAELLPTVKGDDDARQEFVDLLDVLGAEHPATAGWRKKLTAQLY